MMTLQMKKQQGLSLIEFMIAGLIGLILILGLTQIFVSNRQAFDTTAASADVQETGRMATEILAKAIRNADYWGCADQSRIFNNLNDGNGIDPDVLGFGSGLDGFDNNADAADTVADGTDVIVIRGTRGSSAIQLSGPMNNSSAVMDVTSVSGLNEDDIVAVTDCRGGDIFQVTALPSGNKIQHNTGGSVVPGNGKNSGPCAGGSNSANCLSQLYDTGASVLVPYSERYFVGTGVSGEPALFLRRGVLSGTNIGSTQSIELIDGVEDIQILYGEDTNGDGTVNAYRTAATVSDLNDVLSVRASLLVRSRQANVLDNAQTLTFNGAAVDGSDLRLRRVYTMTSTIRNRM
ncbi:PilW family protein [Marinobacter salicampi]|uniref:PilW family protein n=1 Tax=Marinobacter salicampi TaxID=435907 RepID=UPI0014084206|nr:PilW family protein [Marinobacter salicampi]